MANNFFIAYDLNSPGQDYGKIEQAIKGCGDAFKVQLSLYYLKSPHTKEVIIEHCLKSLDPNDRILVIEAADAIWNNLLPGTLEYLQQRWNR